jgi:Rieske Fe-S protein
VVSASLAAALSLFGARWWWPLLLAACRPAPPPPTGTPVPLGRLEAAGRVRIEHRGLPVELSRQADGALVARSLICTHEGCEVDWRPLDGRYACRCHGGVFLGDGSPHAGPVRLALRTLPVTVRDGVAWIDG